MSNLCHPLLPPSVGPFFHTLRVSLSENQHLILALVHPEARSLRSHSLLACVASTLTEVPFYFFQSHLHTSVLPLCTFSILCSSGGHSFVFRLSEGLPLMCFFPIPPSWNKCNVLPCCSCHILML